MASGSSPTYPKARLDGLNDGVFGVAMTLLVIDLRLPEDLHPEGGGLLRALIELWPKFLPYVISFFVLGLRWMANVQVAIKGERVSESFARWWLVSLFLITCVPFTTIVFGRFPREAPAIWLYAGNTALIAAVSARMLALLPDLEPNDSTLARRVSLAVSLASSLAAIVVSLVAPRFAVWVLALNVLTPIHLRRMRRRGGGANQQRHALSLALGAYSSAKSTVGLRKWPCRALAVMGNVAHVGLAWSATTAFVMAIGAPRASRREPRLRAGAHQLPSRTQSTPTAVYLPRSGVSPLATGALRAVAGSYRLHGGGHQSSPGNAAVRIGSRIRLRLHPVASHDHARRRRRVEVLHAPDVALGHRVEHGRGRGCPERLAGLGAGLSRSFGSHVVRVPCASRSPNHPVFR